MRSTSPDTTLEAEKVQIALLQRASAADRARLALGLSEEVIGLARGAIRRACPGASEQEIGLRFVELHYGPGLASQLRRHLVARGR